MPSARLTNCRSSQVEPSLVIWRYPLAWRGDLKVLTNPIYVGEWRFNRRQAKTGREKPAIEVIAVGVPPIIERQTFNEVQRTLKARNPRTTPPRVTTGPVLLTGLAHCACCGSAMTMRTGTSKTGKIYRYYSCSGAARMGKTACNGRSIQMDKLDQLVTSHIADRLLVPDRITDLLAEIIERRGHVARRGPGPD
jgi:site-specific DNA recombinase